MFLLKPHVAGPGGQVTTPDVIVDYLEVDGERRPLRFLTHECWQQADKDTAARPAYCVMALGGGALILPGSVLSNGFVVVARQAWRLGNLDGHAGDVTLNGTPFRDLGLPADMIEAAGGTGDALPRGFLLVRTAAATGITAVLSDRVLGRKLSHRLHLDSLDRDRWGDARPRPRYSVGPTQKEVPHYI